MAYSHRIHIHSQHSPVSERRISTDKPEMQRHQYDTGSRVHNVGNHQLAAFVVIIYADKYQQSSRTGLIQQQTLER